MINDLKNYIKLHFPHSEIYIIIGEGGGGAMNKMASLLNKIMPIAPAMESPCLQTKKQSIH